MARTEKRFGQVNQVPGSTTLSDLVTASANRKNVLINATARGTDTLTAIVTTGALSYGAASSTTSAQLTTTASNPFTGSSNTFSSGFFVFTPNQQVWMTKYGSNNVQAGTWNTNTNVLTVNGLTNAGWNYNSNSFVNGPVSYGGSLHYSNWIKTSGRTGGTKQLVSGMAAPRYYVITTSSAYSQVNHVYNISDNGAVGSVAYWDYPWSSSSTSNQEQEWGLFNEHEKNMDGKTGPTYVYKVSGISPSYATSHYPCIVHVFQDNNGGFSYRLNVGAYTSSTWYAYGNPFMNAMFPYTYNSVYDVYAVQTPIWANDTSFTCDSGTETFTITRTTSHAGVRIVQNNGTTHEVWKPWSGTSTELPAPTGVTVPTDNVQCVRALKFSPDGTKLAIAYDRNSNRGTSLATSMYVIYTRQGNGTWLHTHSSETSITTRPYNADCMKWSPDSSLLGIYDENGAFRVLSFGFSGAVESNVVTIGSGPSLNAGSIGGGGVVHPVGQILPANTAMVSTMREVYALPTVTGGNAYRWFVTGHTDGNSYTPSSTAVGAIATARTTSTIGSVNNYVTTLAQSIPMIAGNVTQISGVVLEPNEKIVVQAGTGGNIDVSASGVEIS